MSHRKTRNSFEVAFSIMLKNKCSNFSVTKIARGSDKAYDSYRSFVGELDEERRINNSYFTVISYGEGHNHSRTLPQVCILGSKGGVKRSTERLLKMIEECPEGVLSDRLRAAYRRHWGGDKSYDPFLEEARKQGEIMKVEFGPVYFNKKELENISQLFLPPEYELDTVRSAFDY